MLNNGVVPHLLYSETPSGQCTVLVSADGERTLCTFLGAACELDAKDLTPDAPIKLLFEDYYKGIDKTMIKITTLHNTRYSQ